MSRYIREWKGSAACGAVLLMAFALARVRWQCRRGPLDTGPRPILDTSQRRHVARTPASSRRRRQENTPVDPALITADNGFGLSLLQTLIQAKPQDTNIAISPTSVAMALQITSTVPTAPLKPPWRRHCNWVPEPVSNSTPTTPALLGALLEPGPQ